MDVFAVLNLLGEDARKAAFEQNLQKLQSARRLDLDALRICIRLLPENSEASFAVPHDRLWDILHLRIPVENDLDQLFQVAEICLGNAIATVQLLERIKLSLEDFSKILSEKDDARIMIAGYLRFLRCSYWLSENYHHLLDTSFIHLISSFVGVEELDDFALDALSALFSLLRRHKKLTIAPRRSAGSADHYATVSSTSMVDQSFWTRISQLNSNYFSSTSSKVYGVWFQWISQVVAERLELDCIYHDDYWKLVRTGLLIGFGDQRKYCLGIIEQSLQAASRDIATATMVYRPEPAYLAAYEQYASLFEMIVLNRYAGQVEASLPELTVLLGPESKITATMATTLLAAAINSKVQEGIRKLVGNWYIDYVIQGNRDLSGHVDFFLEAFLPWATDGSLFSSTLTMTRSETVCRHGEALTTVIAQFLSSVVNRSPNIDSNNPGTEKQKGLVGKIVIGIVRHIFNTGGRIFHPALIYLLQGLTKGLESLPDKTIYEHLLTHAEITEIIDLSRFAGLPEISLDLLTLHCMQLCKSLQPDIDTLDLPGYTQLQTRTSKLKGAVDQNELYNFHSGTVQIPSSLQDFIEELDASKHASIQGDTYAPACKSIISLLDQSRSNKIEPDELSIVLQALWDEAERRDFSRPVAVHLPPLLFHPGCVQVCVESSKDFLESGTDLQVLLTKALIRLQRLSQGRSYILCILINSLRRAVFRHPSILSLLPFEAFVLDYLNSPPTIKSEFLFEVIAAGQLTQFLSHRTYSSYYGEREWHAYAAFVDILNRFPKDQLAVARHILNQLLEPWKAQKAPILIKSPWKDTFQLQAMLLLSGQCINETDADEYIASFMHALTLEPWPRYRFLLEWIIARLYIQFPGRTAKIIQDLGRLDLYSPIHFASLMKLGLLVTPWENEDFAIRLATQLTCYSASPKVHIRHEANYVFPLIFELAATKGWTRLSANPAFVALNDFLRSLEKFQTTPWTIRTLRLDPVSDFTLSNIFQGRYLTIESPEKERVAHKDFLSLQEKDEASLSDLPPALVPTGEEPAQLDVVPVRTGVSHATATIDTTSSVAPAFLQTKAGFNLSSLYPPSGPPSLQNHHPASVILIASLIDNPTNLGGLSRISESFGLSALYISDLKKTQHKDFKATSVTSEKHFPILQLKAADVPDFLLDSKIKGYEVVGIEQTDRSGILGSTSSSGIEEEAMSQNKKSIGTLPQKCVLVLGSEKEGIAAEVLAVIDRCVEIKTVGVTRSLNVQTAGGIAVYEWWREWGSSL
ncbi:hypothetical protein ACN47E_001915 [Coniothyrium glycines]